MKLLEGKTVVVTGAARGIGKAIAIECAKSGADIAFTDLKRDESFDVLEKEISELGVKVKGYESNAANLESSQKAVDEIVAEFGRIDVLVNNAGISMRAMFKDLDLSVMKNLMDVNFWGTVYCTKYALPYLTSTKGSVVEIGRAHV